MTQRGAVPIHAQAKKSFRSGVASTHRENPTSNHRGLSNRGSLQEGGGRNNALAHDNRFYQDYTRPSCSRRHMQLRSPRCFRSVQQAAIYQHFDDLRLIQFEFRMRAKTPPIHLRCPPSAPLRPRAVFNGSQPALTEPSDPLLPRRPVVCDVHELIDGDVRQGQADGHLTPPPARASARAMTETGNATRRRRGRPSCARASS